MEEKISKIFKDLKEGKLSLELAEQQVLDLFAVSVQCEHPYNSILKGNDIRPTQCLKCRKALSEH